MNRRMIVFLMVVLLHGLIPAVDEGRITVEVSGIKQIKGQLIISLYDKPEGFPNTKATRETVFVKVDGTTVTHVFSHLPPGDYALAVIHDANGNGKMDKHFFGLPREKYGFSNNAKAFLRAPSFRKAKFTLVDTYLARISI